MLFCANNIPWAGYQYHSHPLSKINDGQNDIIYTTFENGAGTIRLARTLIDYDDGVWFRNDGAIRHEEIGINYTKSETWELHPYTKGTPTLQEVEMLESESVENGIKIPQYSPEEDNINV